MENIFKLPESSYEELVKVIKAYATEQEGEAVSLDRIANKTGMDKTTVSRNNAFLVAIGIVSNGKRKAVTEQGKKLGKAYTFEVMEEVEKTWQDLIFACDFTKSMYEFVQIRGQISRTDFVSHILFSTEGKNTNKVRAGANALVEIFFRAKMLVEKDGKITLFKNDEMEVQTDAETNVTFENDYSEKNDNSQEIPSYKQIGNVIININISTDDIINHRDKILDFVSEIKNVL